MTVRRRKATTRNGSRLALAASSVAVVLAVALCPNSLLAAPGAIETEVDLSYVTDGSPEQRLDFYWPRNASATVLFVHGRSLIESGERRSSSAYRNVCTVVARAGVACASMDYRLAPTFKWPAMPTDVALAVAAVRRLVAARQGDPGRLFLFGHSSGCQLSAVVGLDPAYLASVSLRPGDLAGVIAMGCVLDRWDAALRNVSAEAIRGRFAVDRSENERYASAEDLLAANPSFHLGAHAPPFLVLLSEEERFAPPILEQGARFVRRLRELSVPAELTVVPGTHMSSIAGLGEAGDAVLPALLSFVANPRGVEPR